MVHQMQPDDSVLGMESLDKETRDLLWTTGYRTRGRLLQAMEEHQPAWVDFYKKRNIDYSTVQEEIESGF